MKALANVIALATVAWIVAGALPGSSPDAAADTLYVASNGVDAAGCGTPAAPCRSITRGIAQSRDGDRIVVGPGRYGDLAGDGSFASAGDEGAEIGFGCACVVRIGKRLTIESSAGPAATVIDPGPITGRTSTVRIEADHATFGTRGKGFTVKSVQGAGISVEIVAGEVKVEGNVAAGAFVTYGAGVTLSYNAASGARQGFVVVNGDTTVVGNVATGTRDGFMVTGASELRGNVATDNTSSGFRLTNAERSTVTGNVAVGNGAEGLVLASAGASQVRNNAFIGNGQTGIRVLGLSTSSVLLSQNNIFGNGVVADPTTGRTGCGVVNELGGIQKAPNNFWGTAAGPAGGSPANAPCNTTAGSTPIDPVATRAFPVSVSAGP